ncbi:MAG TPA: hypothetical protein H9919_03765, partial [Candidatus Alistipes excrementipullorum]|nr:hypothetical protein [Candidatus Alistipes excrementipullorum]
STCQCSGMNETGTLWHFADILSILRRQSVTTRHDNIAHVRIISLTQNAPQPKRATRTTAGKINFGEIMHIFYPVMLSQECTQMTILRS